jgi:hypothetical protein
MKLFRYSASIFNDILHRQEDRINTIDEDALHRQLAFWNISSSRGKPLTQCFTELINKWNDRENHTYLSRGKITYREVEVIDTVKVKDRCQVDFV